MNSARRKSIELLVDTILSEHGEQRAPVCLKAITDKLKIDVVHSEMTAVSGAAVIQGLKKTILLNSSETNPARTRFTIAHELGHIFLHSSASLNVDASPVVHFRMSTESSGSDLKEVEANYFAACLLMPKAFIFSALDHLDASNMIDEEQISQLAKKFEVSHTAMCIRLGALGIA